MGLNNLVIKDGNVTITPSGSTITLVEDGVTVPGGIHLVSTEVQNLTGIPNYSITARNRAAVLDVKTGQFGKAKRSMSAARPMQLAGSGKILYNTVRVELEVHPLLELIDQDTLRTIAVQMILGAGSEGFWRYGARS